MKKCLLSFLVILFIFTSTELHQFLRIPFLFEHYSDHKHYDQSISFSDFLQMHYVNHNHELHSIPGRNDEKEDHELPFQSHDCLHSISTSFYIPINYPKIQLIHSEIEEENRKAFYGEQNMFSSYEFSIWQPPKIG